MTPATWKCSSSLVLRGNTLGKENHNYGHCHLLEARKNTKTAFSTAHHGCICQVGLSPILFSIWIQAGDSSGELPGIHRPCPSPSALPSSVSCSRPRQGLCPLPGQVTAGTGSSQSTAQTWATASRRRSYSWDN